ncbi:mitochondrial inner membrane protease ATP23-like isoform X2 [Salvia hispanica]|uniref:mitochondrial inner membrane protease ATP23-like isoform X2 n=1 Tax=Salvia hispanica TaxID=49212 RepID=UPI00200919A1|nr:mitochondrial inner membrane protease ATP23-like isoform X2 [Salvia hispanica]
MWVHLLPPQPPSWTNASNARTLSRKISKKVKFLIENLEKSGCRIGRHFIRAVNCDQPAAGGFARAYGIEICSNYLHMEDEVVQAMIHELIHAYDDCRVANLRWSDSNHQACSEIRANHLSGDCHYVREILRGHLQLDNLKLKGHEPVCVKRRSVQSVAANHSPAKAKIAVEAVWDTCYNDTAPFDRVP